MTTAVPGLIIAGAASGVGKTSLCAGLIAAWRRRGLNVQAFKAGPDYVDPGFHGRASGRPAYNLDPWMLGPGPVAEVYHYALAGADLALVEGVMGLFDGQEASTARLAAILGLPVVLVLDAAAVAESLAAVALGFRDFDPGLTVVGVVANRVAGPGHRRLLAAALDRVGIPLLGTLAPDAAIGLSERHLGLVQASEHEDWELLLARLARWAEEGIDTGALLRLARPARPRPEAVTWPPPPTGPDRVQIAVAQDQAFSFYYPSNLELLERLGANLVPFSPVADAGLPAPVHGLLLGGGYPELQPDGWPAMPPCGPPSPPQCGRACLPMLSAAASCT